MYNCIYIVVCTQLSCEPRGNQVVSNPTGRLPQLPRQENQNYITCQLRFSLFML